MALEVEKLLDEQKQANASSEYDMLYQSVIDAQSTDTVEDELELENATVLEPDYEVATEDLSLASFKDALVSLAQIGIHYSPILLSKLYKGTVYGIGRLVTGLVNGIQSIADYRIRHQQSFESLREDIAKLQRILDTLDVKTVDEGAYAKTKVINSLKIHDSVDIASNIDILTDSMKQLVSNLSHSVDNDIGYIKQLIASVTSKSIKSPHMALQSIPIKTYLTEGAIEGYGEASDVVQAFHYANVLPGDIRVLAILPNTESDNIDLLTKAYNQSSLYLGLDHSSFVTVDSIPYQGKDEVRAVLKALDALCQEALQHVGFYEHIQITQRNLKYLFRLYISAITSSQQKMPSKLSLIDYVNLKALFIHRIYLPFSIDLHTYVSRVVRAGLQYSEDHIKRFS